MVLFQSLSSDILLFISSFSTLRDCFPDCYGRFFHATQCICEDLQDAKSRASGLGCRSFEDEDLKALSL